MRQSCRGQDFIATNFVTPSLMQSDGPADYTQAPFDLLLVSAVRIP
jgi:hypothetical protein